MIDMSNLEVLPSGHVRLRMQVGKKKIRGTFATVDEAGRMRDAAKREIADEEVVPVDGHSLLVLRDRFFQQREGNRGVSTEKNRWDSHIATADFAPRSLECVARVDILDWLDALKLKMTSYKWGSRTAKPLGWQTRKHCLNLLRSFFSWAVDRMLITANPALGMVVSREDGDEDDGYQETWYLDAEEQPALLSAWDDFDHPWQRDEKWIAAFAIGSGLRQGEQWCLHLADVHVDGPNPHVEIKYGSWDAKKRRYRSPKGRRGEKKTRIVPLFGLALDAIKCWLAILPTYAKANPHGLVFPTRRGARRARSKNPRTWAVAIERFGIVARIGRAPWWHLLRHTCASSLVAGWWGKRRLLEDVRTLLGHSSVKVTERYAHLADSVVHQIATEMQAAWPTSSHVVATKALASLKKASAAADGSALRSRMSGVRIPPGVPTLSSAAVATVVATAAGLLQRVADGESVSTREWVDAVCALIEVAPASVGEAFVPGRGAR